MSQSAITLRKTYRIKQVVTERFRSYMAEQIDNTMRVGYDRYKQIEDALKAKIEALPKGAKSRPEAQALTREMETQYQAYFKGLNELKRDLERVKALPLGDEISDGTTEGFVQLAPGDKFYDKVMGEIVLKDGIVQEIR